MAAHPLSRTKLIGRWLLLLLVLLLWLLAIMRSCVAVVWVLLSLGLLGRLGRLRSLLLWLMALLVAWLGLRLVRSVRILTTTVIVGLLLVGRSLVVLRVRRHLLLQCLLRGLVGLLRGGRLRRDCRLLRVVWLSLGEGGLMRGKGCRGSTGCRLGRLSRLTRGRDSLKWDRRSLGWRCRDWRFDPISSLCPKAQTAELHLHRGHAASRSGQDDTLLCILVPSSSGARTGLLCCRTLGGGSDGHVESRRTSVCRHGFWGQRSSRLVHLAPVGVSARSSNSGILSPCVLLDRLFDSVGIRLL